MWSSRKYGLIGTQGIKLPDWKPMPRAVFSE